MAFILRAIIVMLLVGGVIFIANGVHDNSTLLMMIGGGLLGAYTSLENHVL